MAWRDRMERVLAMIGKEFRQIFRDPRLARLIFVAPLIQLVVFGYAVSTDIWQTPTMVVDHDGSRASRELVDALAASGYFEVVRRGSRSADIVEALDRGDVVLGVEIPPDFSRALGTGSGASVQLLLDGTNSNTAGVARGYAERIILDYALRKLAPIAPPVELRERPWFNPGLSSRDYNVPAVLGALILLVSLLLTSLAIVREAEIGTLEQLKVSPLTAGELIAGKTVPFALIGLVDIAIVTTVALAWFGIPFRGNLLLLLLASVLFLLSGLGLGLLISTISKTQQEAFLTTFLVFLPGMLLSGFMFPVNSMPAAFQWITLLNPLRHFIEIVRAVFLKGAGLGALWSQMLALLLIGGALLSVAAARFRATAAA